MSRPFIRKLLRKLRLWNLANFIRRKFTPLFLPAKPNLLIAVNKSFRWSLERNLIQGTDYLEFGIFRGFTLWYAQALAQDMGIPDMRFFGFDSFQGLPALKGVDQKGGFREGDFHSSRKEVEFFLNQQKTDWGKTFLVEGWFEKTLTPEARKKYGLRRCSVCVIDCDLYESTRLVLEFIEPIIAEQSIILFDDWFDFGDDPKKGQQKAFFEFLERNRHIRHEPFVTARYDGQGFILQFK